MFESNGLPDISAAPAAPPVTALVAAGPMEFIVFRNGQPFAVLNATPALAARTVAGFARVSPGCAWTYEPSGALGPIGKGRHGD